MPEHKIGTAEEWQAARDELAKLEAEQARVAIPLLLAERSQRDAWVATHEPKPQPALVHVQERALAVPDVPGGDGVRRAVRPERRDDRGIRSSQAGVDLRRDWERRHADFVSRLFRG